MASEWLNTILEWMGKHLSWRWVFAIWCVATFFLVLPRNYSINLGLFEFSEKNHVWLFIAFLVSGSFLATYPLGWMYKKVGKSVQYRQFLSHGRERLQNLSPDEKALLSRFVRAEGSVLYVDVMNGTVRILSSQGLIFQASNLGRLTRGWPYKIQPWVFEHLKKNPELLR